MKYLNDSSTKKRRKAVQGLSDANTGLFFVIIDTNPLLIR